MDLNQSTRADKTKSSIHPTLYSKILDLRNIQLELKCESQAKNFNKEEKEDFEDDLRNELTVMILNRKMYFFYYMLSNNNNQDYFVPPFINSLFDHIAAQDSDRQAGHTKSLPDDYEGDININFSFYTSTDEGLQDFAKKCVSYAKKRPNEIDKLTFSVIPGFFEYFWCSDVNLKFRDFIEFVLEEDRDIATQFSRVIFASAELFYNVFDLFITNVNQIPSFISKMDTLKNNLPDLEICTDIFNNKTNLKQNRYKNLSSTLNRSKISEIIEIINEFYLFTESDIETIFSIVDSEEQSTTTTNNENDFTVYRIPPPYHETTDKPISLSTRPMQKTRRQLPNSAHLASSCRNYTINKTSEKSNSFLTICSESFSMKFLRELLVKFPTIQIIAPNNIDDIRISTILANQVCLARDEDRLLFEKQIENLKKFEKEDGDEREWKITPIIQRLREGFQERRSNFQKVISEISKIQDLTTKAENLVAKVQKESVKFIEKIELKAIKINLEKTNEFSSLANNFKKLISKLSNSNNNKTKEKYTHAWEDIVKLSNGYPIKFKLNLLHDYLFSSYKFADYINEKYVAKEEKNFCNSIEKQKNEIVNNCNSGHKGNASNEDFLKNTFLKEKLTSLFNTAISNEQTPVRQILAFSDLFKFIKSVFAQIFTDFNDDVVVKFFTFYIISLDKDAGKLKSSFDYISSFLWFDQIKLNEISDQSKLNELFENKLDALNTFLYLSKTISMIEN